MRRACGSTVRSPSLTRSLLPRGWGVAPLARSTPTLPTRAQRDVVKDTPKKTLKLTVPKMSLFLLKEIYLNT
ncbi:MAG: hypothetical protein NZ455_00100 [Bacteroidia bacterium]|nr:hypothetical protein [Bacteroidia bacterium]MDW8347059.1 hypothetical protein [Bacteroidia bacterium]